MTRRPCPVPLCTDQLPHGQHAVFCVDHYFQLPKVTTDLIVRTKIECSRADDDSTRQHLEDQLRGYISAAIRQLQSAGGANAA